MRLNRLAFALISLILTGISYNSYSQVNKELIEPDYKTSFPSDKILSDVILFQDSLLFHAFNSQKLDDFKNFFSENQEIYQDNTGFRNYTQSMEAFQGLFNMNYVLTRKLLKESVEVYPIKDYGAIEVGLHTFCHTENNKSDCGTYKFVHIWNLKDGNWKITRIITYNH